MDILREICDSYVVKSTASQDDSDIFNCPLKFRLNSDNPCSSKINLSPAYPSSAIRPVKKDAQNLSLNQGFPQGFFMDDAETESLYNGLKRAIEYEDMMLDHPEELTKIKEDFYEQELQKFESPTSMPMLVQNDVSTKYGFGMLNGEIVHGFQEGYLSAQEKFSDVDLENSKIANFKKQILFKKSLQSPVETVNMGM